MANPLQRPKPKRQRISWSEADVMELTQIVNGTSTINGKKMVNVIEEGSNKNNRILETLWDKVTSEFNRRTQKQVTNRQASKKWSGLRTQESREHLEAFEKEVKYNKELARFHTEAQDR